MNSFISIEKHNGNINQNKFEEQRDKIMRKTKENTLINRVDISFSLRMGNFRFFRLQFFYRMNACCTY